MREKEIYNKFLNYEIKYEDDVYEDEPYNKVIYLWSTQVALKTKHATNFCAFFCDNKFQPNKQNMQIVSDGIVIKDIKIFSKCDNLCDIVLVKLYYFNFLRRNQLCTSKF